MRSVLFVDPPAFCTTLEGLVSPELGSRPLAVAPPVADRATLLALSEEARRAGLVRGMPVRKAQRLCPDLIVLPPNPQLYARASRALHEILRVFAPTIEPRGYGHAFLDLTGTGRLFGPPQDVAARIRREAQERLRLPLSVGIASNKLVSQAAIKANRRSNESLLYVPGGGERGFLAPQPLDVLPELDATMRAQLRTWLERSGLPSETQEDVVLACTEAATNAIEHAYIGRGGDVLIEAESEEGRLRVTVTDHGRWRHPRPDDSRGRGLDLVRAVIGDIDVERGEGGTTVRMRVGIP